MEERRAHISTCTSTCISTSAASPGPPRNRPKRPNTKPPSAVATQPAPNPPPFLVFLLLPLPPPPPPAIASACTASLRAPLTARLGRPLPATRSAPGTGRQRRAERGRVASLHLSSSCGLRAGCGAEAGSGPKGGGEGGRDVLLAPPAPLPAPAEPRSLVPFPERKEPQLVAYSTFITNSMKWSLGDKLRAGTPPFFFFFLLLFYLPLHEMRVPNNLEVRAKHRCNSYGYLQYITSSNK